ncbi:MAG: hypothetical protein KC503_21005 [Myxococcales bacterium]|nr:hypothetical protein [Myxococcales bacterium]
MDLSTTVRFLAALAATDPDVERWTFQAFDDNKHRDDKRLAGHRTGEVAEWRPWLEAKQGEGCGVFVTVNRTDGAGRKAENVERVRALFVDIDQAELPEDHPLPPSIVVQSGRGYHAYWLAVDVPLERFTELQKRLIHHYRDAGADPMPHDLPRVMRLPGFAHQKDPANPRVVELVEAQSERQYTLAQFDAALPKLPKKKIASSGVKTSAPDVVERARKYIARCPSAVSGQGGHQQTFLVALHLARGFDLSDSDAWDLLVEYNRRCEPEWSERELRHKLESAQNADAERGYLLDDEDAEKSSPSSSSRKSDAPDKALGKPKISPAKIARRFAKQHRVIGIYGGLYIYRDGVYQRDEDELFVRRWVLRDLGDDGLKRHCDEVVHALRTEHAKAPRDLDDGARLINVSNGLLDWRTGEIRPHTPKVLSIIQLPTAWDAQAQHARADRFLDEVLPDAETRELVEEFFGYCLHPRCSYQKALMMTGEGGNGKSVAIDAWRATLGAHNVSAVSLQRLGERFQALPLVGALANVYPDLPRAALRETDVFKALVTGDAIMLEPKFKAQFSYVNRAKLIFSANELPGSADRTDGFFRRWVVVPFPHSFKGDKADPDLEAKLTTPAARSYWLRLAVEGLRRLVKRGRFVETEQTRLAIEDYRRSADDIYAFWRETYQESPGDHVIKQDAYNRYQRWCEAAGAKAQAASVFFSRVKAMGVKSFRPRVAGERPPALKDVALAAEVVNPVNPKPYLSINRANGKSQ